MKQDFLRVAALLLLATAGHAMASDRELCQAGHTVMLMTEGECQAYLDKRKSFRRRGDLAGLQLRGTPNGISTGPLPAQVHASIVTLSLAIGAKPLPG